MLPLKQVIIIRRDLKMRQGKAVAQGGHSSSEFMRQMILDHLENGAPIELSEVEMLWMKNGTRKVCLRTDSQEQFDDIVAGARKAGLRCHVITDSGATEFHGVKTITTVAIGPHYDCVIDPITGHLDPL